VGAAGGKVCVAVLLDLEAPRDGEALTGALPPPQEPRAPAPRPPRLAASGRGVVLELGQLRLCLAVFPEQCTGQLAAFGLTEHHSRLGARVGRRTGSPWRVQHSGERPRPHTPRRLRRAQGPRRRERQRRPRRAHAQRGAPPHAHPRGGGRAGLALSRRTVCAAAGHGPLHASARRPSCAPARAG
jgi:hypothetical protein